MYTMVHMVYGEFLSQVHLVRIERLSYTRVHCIVHVLKRALINEYTKYLVGVYRLLPLAKCV